MGFKVGDRVRMIRNTYGNRGKIGTLEKIDTSTMPYCVVFDDGRKEWCYGNEFKFIVTGENDASVLREFLGTVGVKYREV